MKHTPVSLIRDIREFTNIKKVRKAHFSRSSAAPVAAPAGAVALGRELHPDSLALTVSEKRMNEDGTVTLLLRVSGPRLPAFRPGQYINLLLGDGLFPFFLSGDPAAAMRGMYEVTADPADPDAFARLSALSEGATLAAGPPVGYFYRQPLRDGVSVAVIADETGLGAGLSMQKGDHAALYLCRKGDSLPDEREISADTVFLCGRKAFCEAARAALGERRVRVLYTDAPARDAARETFSCTVYSGDETVRFDCFSDEPLIRAMERNRLLLFNKCRTGDCAYCRARLMEGRVTHVFDAGDGRRAADAQFGFIHPCRAFPDSDVTLKY